MANLWGAVNEQVVSVCLSVGEMSKGLNKSKADGGKGT